MHRVSCAIIEICSMRGRIPEVSVVSCLLYVGVVERLWMFLSVITAESRFHKPII